MVGSVRFDYEGMIGLWVALVALVVLGTTWRPRVRASSGPLRCAACRYDRTGLPANAPCPECGRSAILAERPFAVPPRRKFRSMSVDWLLVYRVSWAVLGMAWVAIVLGWTDDLHGPSMNQVGWGWRSPTGAVRSAWMLGWFAAAMASTVFAVIGWWRERRRSWVTIGWCLALTWVVVLLAAGMVLWGGNGGR